MKITNQQLMLVRELLSALTTCKGSVRLAASTATKIILMRVETDKLNGELVSKREAAFNAAKEGVENFDEELRGYTEEPEKHEDFKEKFDMAQERFSPVWADILNEEITLSHSLAEEDIRNLLLFFENAGIDTVESPVYTPVLGVEQKSDGSKYQWPVDMFVTAVAANMVSE